jgi:hypothetical protein
VSTNAPVRFTCVEVHSHQKPGGSPETVVRAARPSEAMDIREPPTAVMVF